MPKFVYIFGMPRSGTSIIKEAIDQHPEIQMLPGMTHFIDHVWKYRSSVHRRLLKLIYRQPGFVAEFFDGTISQENPRIDLEYIKIIDSLVNQDLTKSDFRNLFFTYHSIRYFQLTGNKTIPEKIILGEKTNSAKTLFGFRRLFPGFHLILILRDPRSCVSSMMLRTISVDNKDIAHQEKILLLLKYCTSWLKNYLFVFFFKRFFRLDATIIKFESFLKNPASSLNASLKSGLRLRLSFDDRWFEKLNYNASNVVSCSDRGEGIRVDAFKRWDKSLTHQEIQAIEACMGPLLDFFGFEKRSSNLSLLNVVSSMGLKNGFRVAFCRLMVVTILVLRSGCAPDD